MSLENKIDDLIDRFRKQWVEEGDEYHQSDLVFEIIEIIEKDILELIIGEDETKNAFAKTDPLYPVRMQWMSIINDQKAELRLKLRDYFGG